MEISFLMGKNMSRILRYTKIRDVKSPCRVHKYDAGIDLFIPEGYNFTLIPHQRVLIPSGLKFDIPPWYALIMFNKSGVSSKFGLDKLAEVIDSGYQGEVHISVVNTGDEIVNLKSGMKLTQLILVPICLWPVVEVSEIELYCDKSTRSTNGFGSTGE
jgi:dUTP pyrophosphatase